MIRIGSEANSCSDPSFVNKFASTIRTFLRLEQVIPTRRIAVDTEVLRFEISDSPDEEARADEERPDADFELAAQIRVRSCQAI
jgi:hypothetical protein